MLIRRLQRITPPKSDNKNWIIEHLKSNFISSMSILIMTFGLIAIYAYHLHIEYFPMIGIDSFTSIIFATVYVGTLLLIAFGVGMFLPVIYIGSLWQGENKKNTPTQRLRHLGTLSFVSLLYSITWFAIIFYSIECSISAIRSLLILPLYMLTHVILRVIWLRYKKPLPLPIKWYSYSLLGFEHALSYTMILVSQFLPFLMLLLIAGDAPYLRNSEPDYIMLLFSAIFCDFFLLLCGAAFVFFWFGKPAQSLHKVSILCMMVIFPVVASLLLGNVSFFFAHIARLTKVGNFYASEVTLSNKGCAILAKQGVLSCPDKAEETFKLCGAYVMSRLGSETYIKVNFRQDAKAAAVPAAKGTKANSQTVATSETKTKLENVYLPTEAILGMKVDTSVRSSNITKIDEFLEKHVSLCPAEKIELKSTPYSFKATELFAHEQSILSSEGQQKLDAFIRVLADNKKPVDTISIAGHTDQTGNAHYNMTLSQLRALTIENYLRQNVASDIAPKQFHSQGYGNTRPKKTAADCPHHWTDEKRLACFAENRRVEIEVTVK